MRYEERWAGRERERELETEGRKEGWRREHGRKNDGERGDKRNIREGNVGRVREVGREKDDGREAGIMECRDAQRRRNACPHKAEAVLVSV